MFFSQVGTLLILPVLRDTFPWPAPSPWHHPVGQADKKWWFLDTSVVPPKVFCLIFSDTEVEMLHPEAVADASL